jgi:hypothetical protein
VDDGEVAEYADFDVMCCEILDRYRHCGLFQKRRAVDQRFVGLEQ